MSKTKVYVYNGFGCSELSSKMLSAALDRHVDTDYHEVLFISPEDIISGTWTQDAQLLVFGGGFDKGFIKSLGQDGIKRIHDYVWQDGGYYLGICAGAYFACDSIEFDKGGPLEVCGERDLNFFPGMCVGPAYPGFDYNSNQGAVACPVDVTGYKAWAEKVNSPNCITMFIDGGGFFNFKPKISNGQSENGHKENGVAEQSQVKSLALFKDIPNHPPAIIDCKVGSKGGRAILSCVHFEFAPELLIPGENSLKDSVVSDISKSNSDRTVILCEILKSLDIHVK